MEPKKTNPFASIQLELKVVRDTIEKERAAIHIANRKSLKYYTPTKKEIYEALLKQRPETPTQEEVDTIEKSIKAEHKKTNVKPKVAVTLDALPPIQKPNVVEEKPPQPSEEIETQPIDTTVVSKKPSSSPPLMRAIRKHHIEKVQSLLAANVNLNETNKKGRTAIMVAAKQGNAHLVAILVRAGASVNTADQQGKTALLFAIENQHLECVAVLLAAPGIDIHVCDHAQSSALEKAIILKNEPIQCMLLAAGVDTSILTPFQDDTLHAILKNLPTTSPSSKTNGLSKKSKNVIQTLIADVSNHQLQDVLSLVVHKAYDTLTDFKQNHMMLYESYVHDMEHLKRQNKALNSQNHKLKGVVKELMNTMSKAAAKQDVEEAQYHATIRQLQSDLAKTQVNQSS